MDPQFRIFEVWLWKTNGIVGKLIRAQEWTPVNHVELCFPDSGARLDVGFRTGVRLVNEPREVQPGEQATVFQFEVFDWEYDKMVLKANQLDGRKYDRFGLFFFFAWLRTMFRTFGLKNTASTRRICSSACEEVLRAGGQGWTDIKCPIERVTPADFWKSIAQRWADAAYVVTNQSGQRTTAPFVPG